MFVWKSLLSPLQQQYWTLIPYAKETFIGSVCTDQQYAYNSRLHT